MPKNAVEVRNLETDLVPSGKDSTIAVSTGIATYTIQHAHTTHVEFSVRGGDISVTFTGTNPTTTTGLLWKDESSGVLPRRAFELWKATRVSVDVNVFVNELQLQ